MSGLGLSLGLGLRARGLGAGATGLAALYADALAAAEADGARLYVPLRSTLLESSELLGATLNANSGFATDTSNWTLNPTGHTGTLTVVGGALQCANNCSIGQSFTSDASKVYLLRLRVTAVTGTITNACNIRVGTANAGDGSLATSTNPSTGGGVAAANLTQTGWLCVAFAGTGSTIYYHFRQPNAGTVTIDDFELHELLDKSAFTNVFSDSGTTLLGATAFGSAIQRVNDLTTGARHATQTSAALKPVLDVLPNGRPCIFFDGGDDYFDCVHRDYFSSGGGGATWMAGVLAPKQSDRRLFSNGNTTQDTSIYTLLQSGNGAGTTDNDHSVFIRASDGIAKVQASTYSRDGAYDMTPHVIESVDEGTQVTIGIDGGFNSPFSYTRSGNPGCNRTTWGALGRIGYAAQWNGKNVGLLAAAKPMSSANRQKVRAFFAALMA